uniref:Uncharacterized protein n=1 Tax=Trichobilharzia regenti TaxID=157069 RepID=A0AA85ITC8_TRIRE|nr:unnamed protein product [Trichobilharzia regenti]
MLSRKILFSAKILLFLVLLHLPLNEAGFLCKLFKYFGFNLTCGENKNESSLTSNTVTSSGGGGTPDNQNSDVATPFRSQSTPVPRGDVRKCNVSCRSHEIKGRYTVQILVKITKKK